ncbi:cytochrome c oxidase assembly protein COX18, mitochondrial [Coccinella septempunctata]|uniref:cytochrome c oxidase assembly protein COX18, mitochondrial n=1 Tax=Coccinella septempunctata TaxID=41139 RepID=UPI001D06EA37|nr:cytochrome c oxidase assembly protein COX18, mitochondrial [Coccinella septempunctata]
MFSIKPLLRKSLLNQLSYKCKASLSYCCSNDKQLCVSKRNVVEYHSQRQISNAVANSPDSNFFQYYSEIFRGLSESTPVLFIQKSLIDIHNYSGLPWWATIICSTVLLRATITLPLAIYQQIILARLELLKYEMNELVKELKKEATIATKMYKWDERTARNIYNYSLKSNWKKLIIRDNCHPFKTSILLWVQIPLWISVSMSLRNLIYMQPVKNISAEIISNQLSSQGFCWIQNLTEVDSTYILPITFGLINLSLIELATMSKVTVPSKLQKIMTNIFRGFTVLMIPISASVPSGLVLYWTTSSMFGLVQNLTLLSPKVKRFCQIPPTPSELENPYKQLKDTLKNRITRRNKKNLDNC